LISSSEPRRQFDFIKHLGSFDSDRKVVDSFVSGGHADPG
jgi:hypothetical protein